MQLLGLVGALRRCKRVGGFLDRLQRRLVRLLQTAHLRQVNTEKRACRQAQGDLLETRLLLLAQVYRLSGFRFDALGLAQASVQRAARDSRRCYL